MSEAADAATVMVMDKVAAVHSVRINCFVIDMSPFEPEILRISTPLLRCGMAKARLCMTADLSLMDSAGFYMG